MSLGLSNLSRGMYWSEEGTQAVAKMLQAVANGTLKEAFFTIWPHRQVIQRLRRQVKRESRSASIGVQLCRLPVGAAPSSGAIDQLRKVFNRVASVMA